MQRAVEHRTGVQAPAELVWELISDFSTWADWNPIHRKAEGQLKIGTPLTIEHALPGEPVRVIQPIVQDWVPFEQLHWRTSRLGGFVTAIRYIEIENMGPQNSTFSNGELFMGPLVRWVSKADRRKLRIAYTQMGEALRDHAEALWSKRQNSPT
jgi:hypothetical protein